MINATIFSLRFKQNLYTEEWKKRNEEILVKVLKGEAEEVKVSKFDPIKKDWKFSGYKTPIYILMDRGCGSSCESSIHSFEYNPNVKKVGQNTYGSLHFGNIGLFYLPHSLLGINMATHANFFRDGRFIEKIGITPDIYVPDGQDVYDFLVKKIL